jgi:hypothetical protein
MKLKLTKHRSMILKFPGQDIAVQTQKVIDTTHFSIKIAQYIPTPVPPKKGQK